MSFDPKTLISQLMQQNPNMKNNANAMAMVNAVMNNDEKAGVELANNILNRFGMTREQGIEVAKQMFGLQ